MTGSCWRLLAALSLFFVAPAFLRGQNVAVDRVPVDATVVARDVAGLRDAVPATRLPVPVSLPKAYPVSPGTIVFRQIVRPAGIIFSGRVIFVGHSGASSERDPASTTVTFQVEHATRGAAAGERLTIREWAGLWSSGERYRVGERVMLFLYSPGKLGLTSPVAGTMGRFALDSQGKIVMDPQHVAALMDDPILGGRTSVPYTDFALAVRRSSGEQ